MLQPENRNQNYNELFVGIDGGTIKIPKFQREFVWSKDQTAALIDSLVKGFPVGAFTYWETTDELRHVRDIGNYQLKSVPKDHPVQYVLDGQQRITSLYAVRKGAVYTHPGGACIDYKDISIDLSLDPEGDETVVFSSLPKDSRSISVHELLSGSVARIFRRFKCEEEQEKIEKYKTRLESYSFPLVIIGRRYPIDIATEVFTRINTGGTELQLFEIMVAKTYSEEREFDLSDEYQRLVAGGDSQDKCLADVYFDTIDSATVLRCVAMNLGKDTGRREILRIDRDDFIDSWPQVKEGIFAAVTFLRKTMRIPVSRLLPYSALLVPLTYFFVRNLKPTRSQRTKLKEYFWWASLSRRFSGAVDTGLTADRRRMDLILRDEAPSYRGESVEVKRDDLIYQEFSTGEAWCKALLCLYCYYRPRSFNNHEEVTVDNSWLQRIDSKNYHHFFPRSYLRAQGVEDWYANSIMNITIVDDYLNKRKIRAKAPSAYIGEFSLENEKMGETMRTHLIEDLREYGVYEDDYDRFLKKRARAVLRKLRNRLPAS